jgi:hypothetical protein
MEYLLRFTEKDVQVIYTALGELPVKVALQTLGSIQQQIELLKQAPSESAATVPAESEAK